MISGRIISINSGNYVVITAENEQRVVRCGGRLRNYRVNKTADFQIKMNRLAQKVETTNVKLSPKVGDYVQIEEDMITKIEPRFNSLIRPDVANIDQVLLVFAAKEPTFNFYLLDLFLVNILREKN